MSNKEKEQFYFALMQLYKEYTKCIAEVVKRLIEIEEKFPKMYAEYRDFQKDPSKFLELTEKLTEKNAKIVLIMLRVLSRSSILTQKLRNILFLTIKEKRKLVEELSNFVKETEKDLEELENELKGGR